MEGYSTGGTNRVRMTWRRGCWEAETLTAKHDWPLGLRYAFSQRSLNPRTLRSKKNNFSLLSCQSSAAFQEK